VSAGIAAAPRVAEHDDRVHARLWAEQVRRGSRGSWDIDRRAAELQLHAKLAAAALKHACVVSEWR
jgi:hypothetical protein